MEAMAKVKVRANSICYVINICRPLLYIRNSV